MKDLFETLEQIGQDLDFGDPMENPHGGEEYGDIDLDSDDVLRRFESMGEFEELDFA